jgi:serine/threonine protein kinase
MSLCLNPDCSRQNVPTDKFCQKCGAKLVLRERYRAIKLIGQGGFGKTFQSVDEDKPSKPYCVIKQFFPSAQGTATLQKAAELFKEEAIRLDSLGRYPRIPELYAYFTGEDGRQYLVQEYIEGQNLERELKEEGNFNEGKIRQLLGEILPILEFIHGKQVIHRDIKPENIIRRKADNSLVLVDFGAAKFVTPLNRSVTGTVIGSAEYVAPEQGNGKAVNASDLYSLGVTCIYLLTGISPFQLFDDGEHEWVWRQYLVNNNPVSNELGNVLDKLIEFGTKRRYQSASEVLQAMNLQARVTPTIIQPPAIPVTPSPTPVPTWWDKLRGKSPKVIPVASSPVLQSAKGVDYRKLEDLLKQGKWEEADSETTKVMLAVSNRTSEGWLTGLDLDNFPCEDLRTIDRLWVKYSNDRFGFSVQAKIYRELGGTRDYNERVWDAFGDRVGWRVKKGWIYYSGIIFDLKAPQGHLPILVWWGRGNLSGYVRGMVVMGERIGWISSRIKNCKM